MNVSVLYNSFIGGELSPLMAARMDTPNYATGAKRLENAIPLLTGGVRKRPGTWYARRTTNDMPAILIDWLLVDGTRLLVEITAHPESGTVFTVYNDSDTQIYQSVYHWTGGPDVPDIGKIRYAIGNGVVPRKTNRNFILFTSEQYPRMAVLNMTGSGESLDFAVSEFRIADIPVSMFVAVGNGKTVYSTDGGLTWSEPADLSGDWLSGAYGNGIFVAVGEKKAAYSMNGVSWMSQSISGLILAGELCAVTYGAEKFVGLSRQGLNSSTYGIYSENGSNWSSERLPDFYSWQSVAYGGGKFVAVGLYGFAAYSADGINWTPILLPSNAEWRAVTYGGGKFVAVAYGSSKTAYSTDGINWTEGALPSTANWRSITYGNDRFVAIAYDSNKAVYSTNGTTWTSRTLPYNIMWNSITYGNGRFVAVGIGGNSAYSADGVTWTGALMPTSEHWNAVAWGGSLLYGGGDMFMAMASNTNKAAYSADGSTWSEAQPPYSGSWQSITYGGGKFVVVGIACLGTYDGYGWSFRSHSGFFYGVTYGGNKFVAAASNNMLGYSADGSNFTVVKMPTEAGWRAITYGGGLFVAVFGTGKAGLYSTDGINWTPLLLPSNADWRGVTYGGGKFVVVSDGDQAAYSADGSTWTAATLPSSASWEAVTYGGGKFVVVGYNSSKAAYSDDGVTWTAASLPRNAGWRGVTYGNDRFMAVAVDGDKTAYSENGITWTSGTLSEEVELTSVMYGEGSIGNSPEYIKDITFYGGRLYLGGLMSSMGSPTRLIASRPPDSLTGNYRYDDFTLGALAGDAIIIDENDMSGSGIQWVFGARRFLTATERASWGDTGDVPVPATFDMNIIEYAGSNALKPASSKEVVVYSGRDGKTLRALVWQYGSSGGGYMDIDLGVASAHLFDSGIKSVAVMDYPFPTIWIVNGDGELISCSINMASGIVAFARHTLGSINPTEDDPIYGYAESVEVARRQDRDRLYIVVRRNQRESDGTLREVRCIEYLELEDLITADYTESHYVDSGVRVEFPDEGSDTITGLERLRGQEVNVFADGSMITPALVNDDGVITLTEKVKKAHIGLPIKTLLSLNTAQIPANGTSFGKKRRIEKVLLCLYKTIGGSAGTREDNGEPVITQHFGDYKYGATVEPYTGNIDLHVSGTVDTVGSLFLVHDEPTPFTVLAVVERIAIMEA